MEEHLMVQVNIDEIERDFSTYLQRVEDGEVFVIIKAGRPMAEIKPVHSLPTPPRPYGLCAGEFTVPDDFDAPLPESIVTEFEGK
jgi:antitoxin (DNA-binding transcriptional repressor) of toxin-antitoxin stability system